MGPRQTLSIAACVILILLVARSSLAACENPCEATLSGIGIEPALACAGLEGKVQTCDCAIAVKLGNGCTEPIEAIDFNFDLCWSPNEPSSNYVRGCSVVPVDKIGSLDVKLNAEGSSERRLRLRHAGVEHEVTVASNVSSLGDDEGCHCSIPGARGGPAPIPAIASLLLGLAAWMRSRRDRTAPGPRASMHALRAVRSRAVGRPWC